MEVAKRKSRAPTQWKPEEWEEISERRCGSPKCTKARVCKSKVSEALWPLMALCQENWKGVSLRTSTLVRPRPIQGQSNVDFLGEPERSLPQPQDSLVDAGEAINDFWSMSGNFIYRHHVEPRVKLYSPREE